MRLSSFLRTMVVCVMMWETVGGAWGERFGLEEKELRPTENGGGRELHRGCSRVCCGVGYEVEGTRAMEVVVVRSLIAPRGVGWRS